MNKILSIQINKLSCNSKNELTDISK